jgi:regulation of enolase protein 1 (concanavalin A-like superfamily)
MLVVTLICEGGLIMSAKMLGALVVVSVLGLAVGQAQGSPYDRVAYFDSTYGTAWAGGGTTTVRDALQTAGYRIVNGAELKTWMDARIADKRLSVVVMCQDVVPTTVAETMTAACTIRQYLDAGGKVVWYADWPFYYAGTTGTTWGSNGAVQVLGFNASTGPNDLGQLVTITETGRRWGLTTPWSSTRPTSPTVTPNLEVLALDNNGNAAGWVKHYVPGDTFRGFVRIDDHSGAPVDIPQLMAVAEYYETTATAVEPVPEDGATDVPRDTNLGWTPGEFAVAHDVYFGTTFADVNSASRTAAKGLLASQGQAETTYDPTGVLAYGQTYYWRVDEVNKPADNTIFKGDTWSFTVEPYGYPVTPVKATASGAQANMGPEKTIDGSGLDQNGLHGSEPSTMWMSAGAMPSWIQYEFDQVYKLYDLQVWNSNQLIEGYLGFGAKDVTIETSTDGTTWTALANVPEFAKAPGMPGYAANTTVSFGGVEAKFVKLTINSTWGGVAPQTGLSEVAFSYVPVQAREPQPATAATDVSIEATLNWRPGREAGSHKVNFGTDPDAVANGTAAAQTVTEHSYAPASLDFGTTYYWKVDEVNTVTYPGDVWSFTTQEYAVIDDFESYTDQAGEEIFSAWIDGFTTGLSGSTVGYFTASGGTFGETTIVHSGKQSMPLQYDNTAAPFFSEAQRTFDTAQNWTGNGADTLVVYFRGLAPGFAQTASGSILMNAIGTDIWNNADQFRFAYKSLSGDGSLVARVDSLVNSNAWAKAGVMIRQNTDAGSVHAFTAVTPGNSCSFQRRPTTGAASTSDNWTGTVVTAPYWVRITRTGNVFKAETSPDGKTWTALGTQQTIAMTNPVLIGLAVTSHDAAIATSAAFSNVSTTGNVTGAWQIAEIGATQPEGNSVEGVYLSVTDTSGKSKVVQHPDSAATAYMTWQPWTIALSEFTSAGVKVNAVKSLTIGVGNKAAPKAGGTGTVYVDDIGYGHPAP